LCVTGTIQPSRRPVIRFSLRELSWSFYPRAMKIGELPFTASTAPKLTRFDTLVKGVLGVCLFFLCVFLVRDHLDTIKNFRFNDAKLLSGMRKGFTQEAFSECRSESCNVVVVKVGEPVKEARPKIYGRLMLAAPLTMSIIGPNVAPISFIPNYSSDWAARQDNLQGSGARVSNGWFIELGQSETLSFTPFKVKVPSAGYVSQMQLNESLVNPAVIESITKQSYQQRQDMHRLAMAKLSNWRPSNFEFQAMPSRLKLQIDSITKEDIDLGDHAYVVFSSPTGVGQPYSVETKVSSRGTSDGIVYYEFKPHDYREDWVKDYFDSTSGRTPKTDIVEVKITRVAPVVPVEEVSVPKDSIVYETTSGKTVSGRAIVWTAFAGVAIPLHVQMGRVVNNRVNVMPINEPLIGSIRREDWQLVPKNARTKIKVAMGSVNRAYLSQGLTIIQSPSRSLTPGMAVREI
jgi:hypothetical protein